MAPAVLAAVELLDPALTAAIGPTDRFTSEAIAGVCNDALAAVLGPAAVDLLRTERGLLPVVAPWVWDLARGLHFQSKYGAVQPVTTDLLASLGGRALRPDQARPFAESIDMAAVLTLGRLVDQVLGPGACARDPARNDAAAPWLAGLKLGYRIHLVLELLRLAPQE